MINFDNNTKKKYKKNINQIGQTLRILNTKY